MYPILLKLGSFTLHSYGVMVALAFLVAIEVARRDAPRIGVRSEDIADLGFWIIVSAILGARIVYMVFYQWREFLANPLTFFMIWHGGLVFYGGLAGALLGGTLLLRSRAMPMIRVMDLAAPTVALGQGIGRIGCFLNGCCYGREYAGPLSVMFPRHAHPVHPTQLYESAAMFAWAALLWSVRKRFSRPGVLISVYLIGYGMTRFGLEFVRGDGNPVLGLHLTLSQWISVAAVAGVALAWVWMWIRGGRRRADAASLAES